MCGSDVWEFDPWRPFTSLIDDLAPRQISPTALKEKEANGGVSAA
jgi:hypothetical protein